MRTIRTPVAMFLNRAVAVTAAGLACAFAIAACATSPAQPRTTPLTAEQIAMASHLRLQYAQRGTGADPTGVGKWPASVTCAKAMPTTRGTATSDLDESVPEDPESAVVLIQLRGTFTLDTPRPPGSEVPTGEIILVVADPSGALLDVSIRHSPSTLMANGPNVVDLLQE